MRRYLKVLSVFYKAAVLTDLEYRANFFTHILLSALSIVWIIGSIGIFFLHTDRIGDWTFHQMLIILGLFQMFIGLMDMLIAPNMRDIVQHIRTGTMDFILTKPLNSQFHASLRRINFWRTIDMLVGLGVILYAVFQLPTPPSLVNILLFLLLCICAILILYSLGMLMITSSFWLVKLDNVMELLYGFYEAGRFPVSIFPTWLRALLTFVIPIAFVTTVPASVLLNRLDASFVVYSLLVAGVLFTTSVLFWRYAVRHYSSASS
jgi:ABC-2 type transport system permease protein